MKKIIRKAKQSILRTTPYLFKELRDIKKIIEKDEYNLFHDRLYTNPLSLRSAFWKNHFELDNAKKHFSKKQRILDFGCGTGNLTAILFKEGYQIDGIDISKTGIEIAKYNVRNEKNKPQFFLKDIGDFKPREKYDAIWASHVFEHIKDPSKIFVSFKHVLKKDGIMLISVPYKHNHDCEDHVHHFYSKTELKKYLSQFCSSVRVSLDTKNGVLIATGKLKND